MTELSELEEIRAFRSAILEVAAALVKAMTPVIREFVEAGEMIIDAARTAYQAAGSPYGESTDGMLRWLKEVNKAHMLEMEAERIRTHHQMIASFRRQLTNKP